MRDTQQGVLGEREMYGQRGRERAHRLVSSCKDTEGLLGPHLALTTSSEAPPPNAPTLGLGLQHKNLGKQDTIQSATKP